MVLPILVTIPFGDSEEKDENCKERKEFEKKVIDAISKDEFIGPEEEPFYDYWYFYPYKNPNPKGKSLSPSQLYEVLKDELDLFVPISKIENKEEFEKTFQYSCSIIEREIRQKFIPAHNNRETGEVIVSKEEQIEWNKNRIVLVVDDLNCEWIKFFQVSTFHLFKRRAREFKRAGMKLNIAEDDDSLLNDDHASDLEEEEVEGSNNSKDDKNDETTKRYKIRNDPYQFDGNSAALWLNLPSKEYCALNGINATYMPSDMVTINMVNLDLGNMDFNEMVNEPEDVDEQKMIKMIESLG